MRSKIRYATITVARNEERIISNAIQSILNQSIPPSYVIVVDDGSTDGTAEKVRDFTCNHPTVKLIIRRNRGYSALGTYLMADVYNTGMKYLFRKKDWKFLLISSADTILPQNYVEEVLRRMGQVYGVASGITPAYMHIDPFNPVGSGRVIRRDILQAINGFPRTYGWEEGCLLYSTYRGYKIGHFKEIEFKTRQPDTVTKRNYIGWGRAMKDNGVHPLLALVRVLKIILNEHNLRKSVKMLVGYFAHHSTENYDFINFRRANYKQHIINKLREIYS